MRSKKYHQLQTFDQICIYVMQYSFRKLTPLIVSAGLVQVQQKVVGIIPSSTAGTAQSFPAFQPRTATINIRPNTTTSTQQAWALSKMIHSGKLSFICSCNNVLCNVFCPGYYDWNRSPTRDDCDTLSSAADHHPGQDYHSHTPDGPARYAQPGFLLEVK